MRLKTTLHLRVFLFASLTLGFAGVSLAASAPAPISLHTSVTLPVDI